MLKWPTISSALMPRRDDQIIVKVEQGRLICFLPITKPTSKVRVKREGRVPIATRRMILKEEDYIEWQVSYKGDTELARALRYGALEGLWSIKNLKNIRERISNISAFFDEVMSITRRDAERHFYDFKVIIEETPVLRYDLDDGCFVEVVLRHKQQAVGYQPMIYLYIPLVNVRSLNGNSPIGRTAREKEIVEWEISWKHIEACIYAFSIASRTHWSDMIKLIDSVIECLASTEETADCPF